MLERVKITRPQSVQMKER